MKFILKILGFFRAQPIEIPDKLSLKAMEIVSQGLEADVASPVWDQVFSKFPISGRINSGNVNADEIKRFYENYFVNGLSDGACAGMGLSRPRFIFRYWSRTKDRIKKLEKLTDIQGNRPMHRPLSPLLDSGQPWLFKYGNTSINPEYPDHEYFARQIIDFTSLENATVVFIGDGSGVLSNMILNSMAVKKAIFIDLPHFLIRQMIVNSDLNCDQSYFAPNFAANIKVDGRVVFINQDSFPEISSEWVNKYLAIADDADATEVFSYNKVDRSYGHANYHAVLAQHQLQRCYIFESVMRPNYFFEYFKRLK
jgi:hypothetical protein